ncbi:hypothetical protein JCM16303_006963 [Sporobolomyces ruberrimus]
MQYSAIASTSLEDSLEQGELQSVGGLTAKPRRSGDGLSKYTEPGKKRLKPNRIALILIGATALIGTVWLSRGSEPKSWGTFRIDDSLDYVEPLDLSLVIHDPIKPQDYLSAQLKPEVRYITSMSYGGHANQFIGIQNLLYLGKLLNRVVIVPTLTPLHFQGLPQDMSKFYDIERFYEETSIPLVELSTLKWWNFTTPPPVEPVTCWSVLEQVADGRNINDGSMAVHNIDVKYYPLPPLARSSEEAKIWFEAFHKFDSNPWAKQQWIERVRAENLPHVESTDPEPKVDENQLAPKPGFDVRNTEPPNEQLLCLDTTFFLGSRLFPPAYPLPVRTEPRRSYEGHGWIQAGQYLRFSTHLETLADRYLERLFDVSNVIDIPPFITCHIRRGDFAQARGLTSMDMYTSAVQRVRNELDWRIDNRDGWTGPGRGNERYVEGIRGENYAVVVATDEKPNSEFVKTLKEELGWLVIDHDAEGTEKNLGAWYPPLIDSVILAKGQGFVGTEWSTFSYLAGLRVKYWNGGVEDWTPPL